MKELFKSPYGSHLYGTNTPTSDFDYKVIYLPDFDDVLLSKKLQTLKKRADAEGKNVPDNSPMPDGGVETEYVPVQTFCRDFVGGQTYALEIVYATPARHRPAWMQGLLGFANSNVRAMAGFAMKQTWDYVKRGERLDKARQLQQALAVLAVNDDERSYEAATGGKKLRLDHVINDERVIDTVAKVAQLELGTTANNGKEMQTLKLNGREYLETTTVEHLLSAVNKLVDSYGHRSNVAAEQAVDLKSLMHAVRVYEQALELLRTGEMVFPRSNVAELLSIKRGEADFEAVKLKLQRLDDELEQAMKEPSCLPEPSVSLNEHFERWLLSTLKELYGLR